MNVFVPQSAAFLRVGDANITNEFIGLKVSTFFLE